MLQQPYSRREMIRTAAAGSMAAIMGPSLAKAADTVKVGGKDLPSTSSRDYRPGALPVRYPDPHIVSLDKRFDSLKIGNTPIKRIAHGFLWAEGPAWNGVGKFLMWSDIPNDCQHRWLEDDGHVSKYRAPAGNSNGNTFDREGRQISCEHGNRRVVRYEYDGTVTILADKFEGKPFNAPNDAIAAPDGAIWFTDPGYGSLMHYEGNKGPLEIKEAVYRIDAKTGKVAKVADDIFKPNGLCFSPDFKKLYVADTGSSHYPQAKKEIKVWDLTNNGTALANGRTFTSMEFEGRAGLADGIRADKDGNIWASAGWVGDGYDGVHCFSKEGDRIGAILLPEICSNVAFGGRKRNILFMTASTSVYSVYTEAIGAGYA